MSVNSDTDNELLEGQELLEVDNKDDDEIEISVARGESDSLLSGKSDPIDMDTYISYIGEYGLYQFFIHVLLTFVHFPSIFPVMTFYYTGHQPKWTCNPVKQNSTCSNHTEIHDPSNTARCSMQRTSWTYVSFNKSTISTEFDLVCDRDWINASMESVVFIGWGIGIVLFSYLSDNYGRKRVMYPCFALALSFLFIQAFLYNVWLILVARFLMGLFYSAYNLNLFVMLMELVGVKKRVFVSQTTSLTWPLSSMILTYQAYRIDNWRTLIIICSLPYYVCLITAFCIPESVRYLNAKGFRRNAEAILMRAARVNKKIIPNSVTLKEVSSKTKNISYMDLFRNVTIVKQAVAQAYVFFNAGLTYYALNWEFADLGGDMYINSVLSFLVEIPGIFIVIFTLQRFGRKPMNIVFTVVTALSCLIVACTPKTDTLKTFRLIFGLIGKCSVSCLFAGIYLWSSEIYATVARSQGMAINIVTSRMGAACSPFIKVLYKVHPSSPFAVLTFTSMVCVFVCSLLPPTHNRSTRETLGDMIGRGSHVETTFVTKQKCSKSMMNLVDIDESVAYVNLNDKVGDEESDTDEI